MSTIVISPIGHELLDDPGADPALVTESFSNLVRSNRLFGATAAMRFGLRQLLGGMARGAAFSVVDIGAGVGDLPRSAVAWGLRRGIQLSCVGLERSRVAAAIGLHDGLPMLVGCASALPFADRSVDVVMMSQLLHHLSREAAVEVIRASDRIARLGVVVADIRRSAFAAIGFRIAAEALGFDKATKEDGVTSVRRGYLPRELESIMRDAGVRARVHRRPGFRLAAAWRTG